MAYYAITYVYAAPEQQDAHRPAHRQYLAEQAESGPLVVSGPLMRDGSAAGALLIVNADSADDAEALVREDPMNTGGAGLSYTVQEWNPVIGSIR